MKRIASTEFQKAYPRLEEPHEVTALNRVIGHWYPVGSADLPNVHVSPVRRGGAEDEKAWRMRPVSAAPKPEKKK